jgi:hypothetical protein
MLVREFEVRECQQVRNRKERDLQAHTQDALRFIIRSIWNGVRGAPLHESFQEQNFVLQYHSNPESSEVSKYRAYDFNKHKYFHKSEEGIPKLTV